VWGWWGGEVASWGEWVCVEGGDGIGDWAVTGVQTCALPICGVEKSSTDGCKSRAGRPAEIAARIADPGRQQRTTSRRFFDSTVVDRKSVVEGKSGAGRGGVGVIGKRE